MDMEADETPGGLCTPDPFGALLESCINPGEEVWRRRFESTAVHTSFCSKAQQGRVPEAWESCSREDALREVRAPALPGGLLTVSYLGEASVGSPSFEFDAAVWAVNFHTMITETWGLNM